MASEMTAVPRMRMAKAKIDKGSDLTGCSFSKTSTPQRKLVIMLVPHQMPAAIDMPMLLTAKIDKMEAVNHRAALRTAQGSRYSGYQMRTHQLLRKMARFMLI